MRALEFNFRDAVQLVFKDVFPGMSDKEIVRPPVVQRQGGDFDHVNEFAWFDDSC